MRTTMVLDAIEMARWSRGNTLPGLAWHTDAGSQLTSTRYGERLAEIGAAASIRPCQIILPPRSVFGGPWMLVNTIRR